MNSVLLKTIEDLEEWNMDTALGEELEQDLSVLISRVRSAAENLPEILSALIEIEASIVKFCGGSVPESVEFYSPLQKCRAAIAKAEAA